MRINPQGSETDNSFRQGTRSVHTFINALDGLTRHGSALRWLKPTRVSQATMHILTQSQLRRLTKTALVEARMIVGRSELASPS